MAQVPIQGHWIHLLIVAIPLRSPLISNNALVFLAFYILTFLKNPTHCCVKCPIEAQTNTRFVAVFDIYSKCSFGI